MILTHDYKPVLAVLNTPGEFQENPDRRRGFKNYKFDIGLFEYLVQFMRIDREGYKNLWGLSFHLVDFHGSLYDLQEYLQKVYQREISLEAAEEIYYEVQDDPMGDLNLKQEKQVFSTLFEVVKKFVETEKPSCILFSSISPKKFRVYQTMVRRYMPGWVPRVNRDDHMIICQGGVK